MNPRSFAVRMLVEVRQNDDNTFESEVLDFASLNCARHWDDTQEHESSLLEQVEIPDVPGLYNVFLVGHFEVTEGGYFNPEEIDVDYFVDSSNVEEACDEEYAAMEEKWNCELPRVQYVPPVPPVPASPEDLAKAAAFAKVAVPLHTFHWPEQPATVIPVFKDLK